ncbi:MAG: alanine--tRNA ligase [Oligoflexales bacterium]|nr:alanine--tRNA ligase [Oligoflexales bacterium]
MMTLEDYGIPYRPGNEIRELFLQFFEQRAHHIFPSVSLVPHNDPTLLFINAGMNPFKAYFLGDQASPWKRVVDTQKCLRVSGKHNDLDEVGLDGRHHTFFEMLGNWSFGDYYKKESITWAWELLTEVFKIPKNRLFATVYKDDEEAHKLWLSCTDIDPWRVMKFDKDNFWEMGATGPCGPCSEIHFDKGPLASQQSTYSDLAEGVNGTNDRYVEIWNLVFMQMQRNKDGSLSPLKEKHVDTGSGLERLCAVVQNKGSNYETDLFQPVIKLIGELSGVAYDLSLDKARHQTPHQVIADHLRALSFAIADGVSPGSEGRGYVIRRILRRASRFAHQLGQDQPFLYKLVPCLAEVMSSSFPELKKSQGHIQQVLQDEEQRFLRTLGQGLSRFRKAVDKLKFEPGAKRVFPGAEAFLLHDSYGFPIDLTEMLTREEHLTVDQEGYQACMEAQQERGRQAAKFDGDLANDEGWVILKEGLDTKFLGYETLSADVHITRYRDDGDFALFVMLDKTPFYAESGGQVGDTGLISLVESDGLGLELKVLDTFKAFDRLIHRCTLLKGSLSLLKKELSSKKLLAKVDEKARALTARNHSATHLLHSALRKVLGEHVKQQGSHVGPERLRFDFTHPHKIEDEQILAIEDCVNEQIFKNTDISTRLLSKDEAEKEGALAFFQEKYGELVRVLSMGDGFSKELCGGTHAKNTGEIGFLKITSESSIASGVRRIEALTSWGAVSKTRADAQLLSQVALALKDKATSSLLTKIDKLHEQQNKLLSELNLYKQKESKQLVDSILQEGPNRDLSGVAVYVQILAKLNKENSSLFLDVWQRDLPADALSVFLIPEAEPSTAGSDEKKSRFSLSIYCGKKAQEKFKAQELLKSICALFGGRGGGKPDRAQGTITQLVSEDQLLGAVLSSLLPQ